MVELTADGGKRVPAIGCRLHFAGNAFDVANEAGLLTSQYGQSNSANVFEQPSNACRSRSTGPC